MAPPMDALLRRRRQPQENANLANFASRRHIQENQSLTFGYTESLYVWILIISLYIGLLCFVSSRFHLFPEPRVADESKDLEMGTFYESLARRHLETVTSFGHRPTGSDANEIHTRNYILKELQKFQENIHHSKEMLVDVQSTSGSFHMYFIHTDFYSVYRNIKNIVVKLGPVSGAPYSVLMNCHHDTMVDAIGAGDDMSGCAVMMEIVRSLSQSSEPLMHNIIFLFNGAEENLLQGSHGFITQHPWADSIKAFVNLDSAGAGGWEIVFQTGPEHPWLVQVYIDAAVYPSASVVNQEIFELEVVPADTDYRIFRDYGKIPGLDIAYISNGYVYHTLNDVPGLIPPGCLQRAGDNLLNIIKTLATSPKLADPGDDRHGSMVFYDLVGLAVVHYPKRIGAILNCIVSVCAFALLWRNSTGGSSNTGVKQDKMENSDAQNCDGHPRSEDNSPNHKVSLVIAGRGHMENMFLAFLATVATWVVCLLVVVVGITMPLSLCGHSMFWFHHTINMWTIFVLPCLATIMCLQQFFKTKLFKDLDPVYVEQVFFDAVLAKLAVTNLLLTYLGLGMSYLVMLWVLLPLLVRKCITLMTGLHWHSNRKAMLALHMGGMMVPLLSYLYIVYMVLIMIIPVMSRLGSTLNPDITLATLVTVFVLFSTQYLFGLVYLCDLRLVKKVLGAVFAISLLAVAFTSLGFPFSGDKNSLAPQRFLTMHMTRENHDQKGELIHSDSGIWYLPHDFNKDSLFREHIREFSTTANDINIWGEGPYYGVPYFIPVLHLLNPRDSRYIKAPPVSPRPKVVSSLVSRELISSQTLRLTFQVTGPDHMAVYIRPQPTITLTGWSILPGVPIPVKTLAYMNETTYYVYYGHGEAPQEPWQFHIDLQTDTGHWPEDRHVVDVSFSGFYIHGEFQTTTEQSDINSRILPWMVPMCFTTTYSSYKF